MTRKNISQPPDVLDAWLKEARKLDRNLSQLIFEAMNDHLGLFLARTRQPRSKSPKPKKTHQKRK